MVLSYARLLLDMALEYLETLVTALPALNAARRASVPTCFQKGGGCGSAPTRRPNTTHNDGVHWFVIARTRSLEVNADVNIDADRSCLLGECALHRRRFGRRASMIT
jgi:hypothetical protein